MSFFLGQQNVRRVTKAFKYVLHEGTLEEFHSKTDNCFSLRAKLSMALWRTPERTCLQATAAFDLS